MPTNNADSDESTASGTEDEDETTTTGGRGTDISRQQSMEAAGNGAQGPHVTSVTLGEAIIIDLLAFSEFRVFRAFVKNLRVGLPNPNFTILKFGYQFY